MKKLLIHDEVHREVKAEAARQGRSVPDTGSELLATALDLLREGKIEFPPQPAPEPAAATTEG
ncbi:hypothetical protein OKA05_01910 [Luteolibacter arcticus]|uniref:Toxin-antitoxin system n=1 Tax=Luteolibacter arcticus TaxID=1581411 RepID=A0ABT3GCC8_9BACT|nr:hypothetical protein [Luteolibacter arcticus]MCW1921287.1 hypothetical protein [Luteolibacter arcticus]